MVTLERFKSFDQSILLLQSRTTNYFWSSWPPFSTWRFCADQAERSLQRSVCGASEFRHKKWLKNRWTGWPKKDRETRIPRMVENEGLPALKRGQIAALQISFGVMDGKRTALTGWGQSVLMDAPLIFQTGGVFQVSSAQIAVRPHCLNF